MDLPRELPIFPLTGCLLLPGNFLPLNVFESRYLALVRDARAGEGYIGMVQPYCRTGQLPEESPAGAPRVFPVGCAGVVEKCEPQPDGRIHLLLRGVIRFRIQRELEMIRGYRRVEAQYAEFSADLVEPQEERRARPLLAMLGEFARRTGIEFDLARLRGLPGTVLLNALCAALPFSPVEKQALLEAAGADERQVMLADLMQMTSIQPEAVPDDGSMVH